LPRLVKALIAAKIAKTKNMNELSPKGCAFKGGRFSTILIFFVAQQEVQGEDCACYLRSNGKANGKGIGKSSSFARLVATLPEAYWILGRPRGCPPPINWAAKTL
jgi:hypothetical protein